MVKQEKAQGSFNLDGSGVSIIEFVPPEVSDEKAFRIKRLDMQFYIPASDVGMHLLKDLDLRTLDEGDSDLTVVTDHLPADNTLTKSRHYIFGVPDNPVATDFFGNFTLTDIDCGYNLILYGNTSNMSGFIVIEYEYRNIRNTMMVALGAKSALDSLSEFKRMRYLAGAGEELAP